MSRLVEAANKNMSEFVSKGEAPDHPYEMGKYNRAIYKILVEIEDKTPDYSNLKERIEQLLNLEKDYEKIISECM